MNLFKSLKMKLIVSTALIVLIAAIANLVVGIITSNKSITTNVETDLKSIGSMAQVAITNDLEKIQLGIESVAQLDAVANPDLSSSDLIKALNAQKEKYGYQALSVVTSSGKVTSTDSALNNKSIANQEYFTKALAGKTYISSTIYDINNKLTIVACAPVNTAAFKGVVMASLDIQTYSNIIKDITIGKSGNVFILDKEGTVIANIRPEMVEGRSNLIEKAKQDSSYNEASRVYQKMTAGGTGIDTYSFASVNRICYYTPIPDTDGWSCGSVAPISEMTSSVWYTIIGLIIASATSIILGIIGAILLSKNISSPITLVCNRLKLLAMGDLTTNIVNVNTKDETHTLATALNQTVLNLREYIEEITNVLGEVANGNMTVEIQADFDGDFSPIKESIVTITASLSTTLSNINQMADQVSTSSNQVSDGASLLSENTTEQAGAIEELSSTLFEISEKTNQNSQNAEQASAITQSARETAEKGSAYMNDMLSSMQDINSSSENISKIIKVIEDISFQTNILALNAAVEAARAGAAGKGFAVVADEVRNLATKSSQAAKETTALIEDSIEKVQLGTRKANHAANALTKIVSSVEQSNKMVLEIAEASKEQSVALDEVKSGINQITQAIQNNSATSEESAATSAEMNTQAQELKNQIATFKLSEN